MATRDLETLRALVASVTDYESRKKICSKPFTPKFWDVVISDQAPQFYSEEELEQIKLFSETAKSLTKNIKKESRKRKIEEIQEEERVMKYVNKRPRRSPCIKIEEIHEEERVIKLGNKKPRKSPCKKNEEKQEEERVIMPVNKKPIKIKILNSNESHLPTTSINGSSPSPLPSQSSSLSPSISSSPSLSPSTSPSPSLSPSLPVELSAELKKRVIELNGHDLKYLMHKKLFKSDVNKNSNRLSLPMKEMMCDFLTETEIAKLDERDEIDIKGKGKGKEKGRLLGINVILLDPYLREFTLSLRKWSMKSTQTYNLVKNWHNVVTTNNLKEDQELQIWTFRVHDNIYFLLNKL